MGTTEGPGGDFVSRLGVTTGAVVQEFGYDSDVDQELREQIEDLVDADLVDEDHDGVVDLVICWWRDGDGDLGDMLVDTLGVLGDHGAVILLTPKAGRDLHVEASEIEEAAQAVGLHAMRTQSAGESWSATRLGQTKGARRA